MFTFEINIGHLFLDGIIAVIGFVIRRELARIDKMLEKHDIILDKLVKDTDRLIIIVNGKEN